MSADETTHYFLHQDCLISVSDHGLIPKAWSLLLAPHHPLREGKVNNGRPDGRAILGRIIHESSAHLKFDRAGNVRSSLAQESGVLGGASCFCTRVT